MSDDLVTAAITSAAATLESSSTPSATIDASSATTATEGTTTTSADPSTPAGAVDIPSDPQGAIPAQEVAEEAQDPSVPAGTIPTHRHKAVLTNERNKHAQALQAVQTQLESLKWAQQPDMPDRLKALEIAESNPDLFVQVLKQDPRYARLLNTPAEQPAAPALKQEAQAFNDPMPQADVQAGDGTLLYSAEQAAQLTQWLERKQEARVKQMLEERFAPLEKERQEAQQVREQQQMWGQAIERQKGILTDARSTWPLFNDLETGIRADLAANPAMSLETAYRRALVPRMQADRDKMRKELLAEIGTTAPVAGSVRPGSGPAIKPAATRDMTDIIAEIARGLGA